MTDEEKNKALLEKKKKAEEKYKFLLSRFHGVPHESASGELAYSDLKVAEDYLNSIITELEVLQKNLGRGPEV